MLRGFVIAFVLSVGPLIHVNGQQRPEIIFRGAEYVAPPSTIEEMWLKAAVVVLGEVQASRQSRVPQPENELPSPIIEHDIHVRELLKDDGRIGNRQVVTVAQMGGSIVVGGTQVKAYSEDFPPFAVGQQVVLFLEQWPAVKAYGVLFGPAGAFKVLDGNVRVPPSVQKMPSFKGLPTLPLEKLMSILRALR